MTDLRIKQPQILIDIEETFTRSNGTIVARIYERLTKASRRRDGGGAFGDEEEIYYRRGVYDAFKALQQELDWLR